MKWKQNKQTKKPKTEWELVKLKKKKIAEQGNHWPNEKTTYWIEENICKWYDK